MASRIRPAAGDQRRATNRYEPSKSPAIDNPDMYVSPAVRSIREHPLEDESISLLVRAADDIDELRERVEAAGGTVEDELEFETLAVSVQQTDVGTIAELAGIESIETDRTLTMDADGAGEDVSSSGE